MIQYNPVSVGLADVENSIASKVEVEILAVCCKRSWQSGVLQVMAFFCQYNFQ